MCIIVIGLNIIYIPSCICCVCVVAVEERQHTDLAEQRIKNITFFKKQHFPLNDHVTLQ